MLPWQRCNNVTVHSISLPTGISCAFHSLSPSDVLTASSYQLQSDDHDSGLNTTRGALVHFSEEMFTPNISSSTPWIALISCEYTQERNESTIEGAYGHDVQSRQLQLVVAALHALVWGFSFVIAWLARLGVMRKCQEVRRDDKLTLRCRHFHAGTR